MLVAIMRMEKGTCVWCTKPSDDGLVVEFKDGLTGCLCRRCFWAALKVRAEKTGRGVTTNSAAGR